jgi:hypothetical protein
MLLDPIQEMLRPLVTAVVSVENTICLPKRTYPLCGSFTENIRDFLW